MKKRTIALLSAASLLLVGVGLSQVAEATSGHRLADVVDAKKPKPTKTTKKTVKPTTKKTTAAPKTTKTTKTTTPTTKTTTSTTTAAPTTSTTKPPVTVRSVALVLGDDAKVGQNLSGYVRVIDTTAEVVEPIAAAEVSFQQQRGAAWTTIASGVTDANGTFAVAITARNNTTLRALYKPATGKSLTSDKLNVMVSATVTWAARPDLAVTHGVATPYSFRITADDAVKGGHLEYANASDPTKWTKAASVALGKSDVIKQSITFPSAGTWLVRGASDASSANASGYTTSLTVTVS